MKGQYLPPKKGIIVLLFFIYSFFNLSIASTENLINSSIPSGTVAMPQVNNAFKQLPVSINTQIFDVFKLSDKERLAHDIPDTLLINLFDGESITAILDKTERVSKDSVSWIGHIEGKRTDSVILVVNDKILQGDINQGSKQYQIRYLQQEENGKVIHLLKDIDFSTYPPDHPDDYTESAIGEQIQSFVDGHEHQESVQGVDGLADDGSTIDVMVVYTASARAAVGGTAAMNTLIDLAVTETNQGYSNSSINPLINLVHKEEITYTESGSFSTDVNRLQNISDGYMDNVHTLRDAYFADMVGLLVNNSSACGRAYTINASASSAFQVTHYGCATGYYSFAHEFGHLQGARHDWRVDPTNNSPYTYNHGYVNTSEDWRTVMAYNNSSECPGGNCARLNYWSNPDVNYGGFPMGVPEGMVQAADNRKTLNNTAYTVANFRANISGDAYEPDNNPVSASVIINGQFQTHSIHIPSDLDWATFSLDNAADITLETSGASGNDTRMWLYDSTGTNQLDYDDDGGDGLFSLISQAGLAAGTYYVKIDEFGNNQTIDSYQLDLEINPVTVGLPSVDSPAPDSTLSGASETFTWQANGKSVSEWWLYIGSTLGAADIYDSGSLGTVTSHSVTGLPVDGSSVHVKLWYKESGIWKSVNAAYTAATVTLPAITSPTPGSTMASSTETFNWSANGVSVTEWWLYIGSSPDAHDIYDSGSLGIATSYTVSGLPVDGSSVYFKLWYKESGIWKSVNATYTAVTAKLPVITSPTPGSIMSGSTETFNWSANGVSVTEWWLYIGSTPGAADIYDSGSLGTVITNTVSGLPVDGSTVYVTLWYKENGSWKSVSNIYMSATNSNSSITLVSTESDDNQGNGNSGFGGSGGQATISEDGRYVVFLSSATNWIDNDNATSDVYVKDRQTGDIELISIDLQGNPANRSSYMPTISRDGRYVGFWNQSNNLVAGDSDNEDDYFVRDRQTDTTRIVPIVAEGNDVFRILGARISGDGRFVVFISTSDSIVENDTNGKRDVFVHDLSLGSTERVNVSSLGEEANGDTDVGGLYISRDGRYVAFASSASNLVSSDTNNRLDIFIHDRQTDQTNRANLSDSGEQALSGSSYGPMVTDDGRYVVFSSNANNLVENDNNDDYDIFIRDLVTETTELLSIDNDGNQDRDAIWGASVSQNGRFVTFSTYKKLAPEDLNEPLGRDLSVDVYLRDRQLNETRLISKSDEGIVGNDRSEAASISASGSHVVFNSSADNLVTDDNNTSSDVFIKDLFHGGFNESFTSNYAQITQRWRLESGYWEDSGAGLLAYYALGQTKPAVATYNDVYTDLDYSVKQFVAFFQGTHYEYQENKVIIRASGAVDSDGVFENQYLFRAITSGSYQVLKRVDGEETIIQDWTNTSNIHLGPNIFRVRAVGSSLEFYINGILTWSGTDSSLTQGRVGLGGDGNWPWADFGGFYNAYWATLEVPQ